MHLDDTCNSWESVSLSNGVCWEGSRVCTQLCQGRHLTTAYIYCEIAIKSFNGYYVTLSYTEQIHEISKHSKLVVLFKYELDEQYTYNTRYVSRD